MIAELGMFNLKGRILRIYLQIQENTVPWFSEELRNETFIYCSLKFRVIQKHTCLQLRAKWMLILNQENMPI